MKVCFQVISLKSSSFNRYYVLTDVKENEKKCFTATASSQMEKVLKAMRSERSQTAHWYLKRTLIKQKAIKIVS